MATSSYINDGSTYLNKDFVSIYTELLDLVKVLTNKWDPSLSNESDPGVVLLKLGALLSDKNMYNLDKNILEMFPQTVSQYGNARRIYDILGYNMKWYTSATTTVNFTYTGSDAVLSDSSDTSVVLQPLQTMISDDSGEIVYTLLDPVVLNTSQRTGSAECIQGVVKDYEVNGVSLITLDNLDAYNRIYFDESLIAQNGVFIANDNGTSTSLNYIGDWSRVDNLESNSLNSKIFKFGVTSDNICFIEFPQDIANLIGGGLRIKYIVTTGASGNISANTLTTFYSSDISILKISSDGTEERVSVSDDINIVNAYSTTNGADYESLEEAYDNYKKVIGTFNTLVTCKDYESAIYNILDTTGRNYAVSNIVVSDRTNDINNSSYIISKTINDTKEKVLYSSGMDAFSIGIYALAPMSNITNAYYFNKSFSVNTSGDYIKFNTDRGIPSYKCIQHDYIDTTPVLAQPYIYKNCYKLTGTVATYYKVSSADALDIENNIRLALYKAFNARNVEFGVEPSYDLIVETIKSADSRIKYVMLNPPQYVVKVMYSNDQIGSVDNALSMTADMQVELLAKMITAGNIQLFKFDENFDYDFGQTNVSILPGEGKKITSITTQTAITPGQGGNINYTVRSNENIQIYTTNLIPAISYTAYVNYRLSTTNGTLQIAANQLHILGENETLYINYVDTNNSTRSLSYGSGTIIRPTIAISSDSTNYNIEKTLDDGSKLYFAMLSADQSIDIMEENATTFDSGSNCLWFTNNSHVVTSSDNSTSFIEYTLFDAPTPAETAAGYQSRILQNNEYFLYTNSARNELVILSSGTKLVRKLSPDVKYSAVQCQNSVDVGLITSNGQSAISETDWFTWVDAIQGQLSAHELSIVTLGEGVTLQGTLVANSDGTYSNINNTPQVITSPKYKGVNDTQWTTLPTTTIGQVGATNIDTNWYVVSRLNIVSSPTVPQQLQDDQSITYYYQSGEDISSATINGPCYILTNEEISLAGGTQLDVTTVYADGTQAAILSIYQYTLDPDYTLTRNDSSNIVLSASEETVTLPFSFFDKTAYYLIPVIKARSENELTISGSEGVTVYNYTGQPIAQTKAQFNNIVNAGVYYLLIPGVSSSDDTSLSITWSAGSSQEFDTSDVLTIGAIHKLSSSDMFSDVVVATVAAINQASPGSSITTDSLLGEISTLSQSAGVTFDYSYQIDPIDALDFTVVKNTINENNAFAPSMLWNVNHICNKFTIGEMDTLDSSITVSHTSRS